MLHSFGSFITGRLALQFGAKNRIYLLSTFVVQALVLQIFAILILTQTISLDPIDSHFQLLIVFPLAIVFGAQVAISRPFSLPAIPTGMFNYLLTPPMYYRRFFPQLLSPQHSWIYFAIPNYSSRLFHPTFHVIIVLYSSLHSSWVE